MKARSVHNVFQVVKNPIESANLRCILNPTPLTRDDAKNNEPSRSWSKYRENHVVKKDFGDYFAEIDDCCSTESSMCSAVTKSHKNVN